MNHINDITKRYGSTVAIDHLSFEVRPGEVNYLVAVGLLGVAVGAVLRRTAGAVDALVGVLVLTPLVTGSCRARSSSPSASTSPPRPACRPSASTPTPTSCCRGSATASCSPTSPPRSSVGAVLLIRRDT